MVMDRIRNKKYVSMRVRERCEVNGLINRQVCFKTSRLLSGSEIRVKVRYAWFRVVAKV